MRVRSLPAETQATHHFAVCVDVDTQVLSVLEKLVKVVKVVSRNKDGLEVRQGVNVRG